MKQANLQELFVLYVDYHRNKYMLPGINSFQAKGTTSVHSQKPYQQSERSLTDRTHL